MPKFIFILFLFFCSLHAFSQKDMPNPKTNTADISDESIAVEKEKEKVEAPQITEINETEIDLLLNDNLCEILSIKVSDLLNESMIKKLKSNG